MRVVAAGTFTEGLVEDRSRGVDQPSVARLSRDQCGQRLFEKCKQNAEEICTTAARRDSASYM